MVLIGSAFAWEPYLYTANTSDSDYPTTYDADNDGIIDGIAIRIDYDSSQNNRMNEEDTDIGCFSLTPRYGEPEYVITSIEWISNYSGIARGILHVEENEEHTSGYKPFISYTLDSPNCGPNRDAFGDNLQDFSNVEPNDGVNPIVTDLNLFDTDYDGKIDEVKMRFSEEAKNSFWGFFDGGSNECTLTLPDGEFANMGSVDASLELQPIVTYSGITGQIDELTSTGSTAVSLEGSRLYCFYDQDDNPNIRFIYYQPEIHDNAKPILYSAVADYVNPADGVQAGDSVELKISECVPDFGLNASNIDEKFNLGVGKTWLSAEDDVTIDQSCENGNTVIVVTFLDANPNLVTNDRPGVGDTIDVSDSGIFDTLGNAIHNIDTPLTGSFDAAPKPVLTGGTVNELIEGTNYLATDSPTVTFTSDSAGTVSYSGCESTDTVATAGENTVEVGLMEGWNYDCTLSLVSDRGILSDGLEINNGTGVYVDITNPTVTSGLSTDNTRAEGQTFSYLVSVSDNSGGSTLVADSLPTGATFDVYQNDYFYWTPDYDQAGAHQAVFTATDLVGNETEKTFTLTVTNKNREPSTVTSPDAPSGTYTSSDTLEFTLVSVDPDGDTVTFSPSINYSGLSIGGDDGDEVTWDLSQLGNDGYKPSGNPNYISVLFTASDGTNESNPLFVEFYVNITNNAPAFTNPNPETVTAYAAYSYDVSSSFGFAASDPDGDTLDFELESDLSAVEGYPTNTRFETPAGGFFAINQSNGYVAYNLSKDDVATYDFNIVASDGSSSVKKEVEFVFTPSTNLTINEIFSNLNLVLNQLFSVTAETSNNYGTVSYSISGEPTGMNINSGTGEIQWTPTESGTTYDVNVYAEDESTTEVSTTFSVRAAGIIVDPISDNLPINRNNGPYEQEVTFYNNDGVVVLAFVEDETYQKPTGMRIDDDGVTIVWDVTSDQFDTLYNIKITATDQRPSTGFVTFSVKALDFGDAAPDYNGVVGPNLYGPYADLSAGVDPGVFEWDEYDAISLDLGSATDPDGVVYSIEYSDVPDRNTTIPGLTINSSTGLVTATHSPIGTTGDKNIFVRATDATDPNLFTLGYVEVTITDVDFCPYTTAEIVEKSFNLLKVLIGTDTLKLPISAEDPEDDAITYILSDVKCASVIDGVGETELDPADCLLEIGVDIGIVDGNVVVDSSVIDLDAEGYDAYKHYYKVTVDVSSCDNTYIDGGDDIDREFVLEFTDNLAPVLNTPDGPYEYYTHTNLNNLPPHNNAMYVGQKYYWLVKVAESDTDVFSQYDPSGGDYNYIDNWTFEIDSNSSPNMVMETVDLRPNNAAPSGGTDFDYWGKLVFTPNAEDDIPGCATNMWGDCVHTFSATVTDESGATNGPVSPMFSWVLSNELCYDNDDPVIELNGDSTINVQRGDDFEEDYENYNLITVTDTQEGDITTKFLADKFNANLEDRTRLIYDQNPGVGDPDPLETTILDTSIANKTFYILYWADDDCGGEGDVIRTVNIVDTTAPTLAQVVGVSNVTNDTTPTYEFSSDEAGTISYNGDCSSATTSAVAGNNQITFNTLPEGLHSNCTITVTDSYGNTSSTLFISAFTINTDIPGAPTASVDTGTFNSAISVALSNGQNGVDTYFTVDGTEPDSTDTEYTNPISIDEANGVTKTLKAVSYDEYGTKGTVMTKMYTFDKAGPNAPTANPAEGIYNLTQTVTLTLAGDADETYYTLNGNTPDNTSSPYIFNITVSGNNGDIKTLKAVSYDAAGNKGSVMTEVYTFDTAGPVAPTIDVTTGVYTEAQTVTITPPGDAVSTYYSTDGTTPDDSKTQYTAPISVDGANNVTVTLKTASYDAAGNLGAIASEAYTFDKQAPVISLNGANPQIIEYGDAYVELDATATDNLDGDLSGSIAINSGVNVNVVGSYSVTYNVSDSAGNDATQVTRTVDVVDTQKPVITRTGDATVTLEVGTAYNDSGATATDNYDGDISGDIVKTSNVDTSLIGSYTVNYNVDDTSGNSADQVSRTVNVVDTTDPVITVNAPSPATFEVNSQYIEFGATATDNYDGKLTGQIVTDSSAVNMSLLGIYTVTYNVDDFSGNSATEATRTVNVVDTTKPVITLQGSNPASVLQGATYTDAGATANDNYDGDLTGSIATNSNVNTAVIGTYSVTYNVSDGEGNAADQVTRTVNVISAGPPIINLTGDNPQTIEAGTAYSELGATATDAVDGDLTGSIIIDATGVNTAVIGGYSVTYEVTNSNNDTTTETRTVNVVDTTKPVITRTGDATVTVEAKTVYTDQGATASDNYDGDISGDIVTTSNVDTDAIGTYTVTYNVNDSSDNVATQVTRTVNVVDTTPPVITITGDAKVEVEVFSVYTDQGATALDTYDGVLTGSIVTVSDVDTDVLGEYTVTYDVNDTSDNMATQKVRDVNVVDTTAPVITLNGNTSIEVELNDTYTDAGATSNDNYDGNLTSSIVTISTVDTAIVGTYTVTYQSTDSSGNLGTKTRTVEVIDSSTTPVVTRRSGGGGGSTPVSNGFYIKRTDDSNKTTDDTNKTEEPEKIIEGKTTITVDPEFVSLGTEEEVESFINEQIVSIANNMKVTDIKISNKELQKDNVIEFTIKKTTPDGVIEEKHTITIKEVMEDKVIIVIESNPITLALVIGLPVKLDIDKDGSIDTIVELRAIENGNVTIVTTVIDTQVLTLEEIEQQKFGSATDIPRGGSTDGPKVVPKRVEEPKEEVVEEVAVETDNTALYAIVGAIILVIIVLGVFFLHQKNGKKKTKRQLKEEKKAKEAKEKTEHQKAKKQKRNKLF